ncbi:TonB-dependent receptor [Ottowia testudinis]|uniref:TonB-dependent receptor n=1 Tax=Ottowia testudinis TaxID=2816950 RepID=A0A975H1Y3_9BURK|nr:TonB-dependent receptor [Ottowia testudinis]QTD43590.1 TonB-dependent receptor [Ottowia testudinis]
MNHRFTAHFQSRPFAMALGLAIVATTVAAETDATRAEGATTLGTVTVTARRGEELAKDVPFSVSTISGDDAEARRLYSLEDMLRQTPGIDFVVNSGAANTTLRIRGVGSLQKVSGDDSSVVINVDGLPLSAANANLNVLDAERVEILKGPQGTLFGRNAEAGAVNIVTRKPTRWFEGYARTEAGQAHHQLLEGAVSGPLTETFSARLAMRGLGIDSVRTNVRDGEPLNKPRELAVRGSLLWQPTSRTRLFVTAGHDLLKNRDVTIYGLYPYGRNGWVDVPRGGEWSRREGQRYTAELTHEMDASNLTLLSGYADTKGDFLSSVYEGRTYRQLLGFQPDARWRVPSTEKTYNQEIRLASKPGAPVFWVAGLNVHRADRSKDNRDAYDNYYPANPYNADIDRRFRTDAQAAFGEVTIPVQEKTRLTLGARYTWEKKRYAAHWVAKPDNPNTIREAHDTQSLKENYATGRVALSHALSQQINVYGVYARGHKAGGFNDEGTNFTTGLADPAYKPAIVDSVETGFKFESADKKMAFNAAIFLNKVTDDHLLTYDVQSFAALTENYDTESKGIELEGAWHMGSGWTISGGLAYIDARIKGSKPSSVGGVSGNRTPEVPKWAASLAVGHRMKLPAFLGMGSPVLQTQLSSRFVGTRPADPQNSFNLTAYNKVDLRVGIQDRNTEIYFWADNLLNKQYDLYGYYIPPYVAGGSDARIGAPGRGRSLGVGINVAF